MFRKTDKNLTPFSAPETTIPDPWEAIEPEPHFPTPLELDRLLNPGHLLIGAATPHAAISAVQMPSALLPPHADLTTSPVKVLLQNELKLSASCASVRKQVGNALALLYWDMINREIANSGMPNPEQSAV